MSRIGELGMGAAQGAVGQGMGLIFGGIQDARQRKQAQKLTDIQSAANERAADYSQKLAKDMWNYTSYPNQVKKMEEAGLNVGLMYGGTGAGGTTGGAGTSSGVSGNSPTDPSAATGMGIQLGEQIALMKAQRENIEADTANKKASTEQTGVSTEQGKVNLDTSKQIQAATVDKAIEDARKAMAEAKNELTKSIINEETYKDQIQGIKAEAAGEMLKNLLTKAEIKLTDRKIWEIAEKVAQGWKGIEFQGVDKVTGKYIEQVVDWMKKLLITSGGN